MGGEGDVFPILQYSNIPSLQPIFPGGFMARIIESLTEYMLAARHAALPAEVVQKGKSHLLDSLAAVVSGSTLKPGKLGLQHARDQGGAAAGLWARRSAPKDLSLCVQEVWR